MRLRALKSHFEDARVGLANTNLCRDEDGIEPGLQPRDTKLGSLKVRRPVSEDPQLPTDEKVENWPHVFKRVGGPCRRRS